MKHGSEAAQHLKTPVLPAKAVPSSTAVPNQAANPAPAQDSDGPASAVIPDASQQKADSGGNPSKASTGNEASGPGASAGQPHADPPGQRAAQLPKGCLTERNASSAKAGPTLPPKPPKAAKRLKFSELSADLASAPSQACTSAITALAQQLAKPVCQAEPPHEAQPQVTEAVGPHLERDISATQGAAPSDAKSQAAASPVSAQTRSQKQSDAQQSSDTAPQAEPDQAAGSKGQSSSQSVSADGSGPPGSPSGAPERYGYCHASWETGLHCAQHFEIRHVMVVTVWLGFPDIIRVTCWYSPRRLKQIMPEAHRRGGIVDSPGSRSHR